MANRKNIEILISIINSFDGYYEINNPVSLEGPLGISIFTEVMGNLADKLLCSGGYPTGLINCKSMNGWSEMMSRNVYALTLSDRKTEQEKHDEDVIKNSHLEIDDIMPGNPDMKRYDRVNVHPWRNSSWHNPLICMIDENQCDLHQITPVFIRQMKLSQNIKKFK